MALAALSPTPKDTSGKGELGPDAARALCLAADHKRQGAVFPIISKPVNDACAIRPNLTQDPIRVAERVTKIEGVDAHEAALLIFTTKLRWRVE